MYDYESDPFMESASQSVTKGSLRRKPVENKSFEERKSSPDRQSIAISAGGSSLWFDSDPNQKSLHSIIEARKDYEDAMQNMFFDFPVCKDA